MMNTGALSHCEYCPPGYTPSIDQSECVLCDAGYIKADSSSLCTPCPEFTTSDPLRTKCVTRDLIINKDYHMVSLHKISRFDLFCMEEENFHACDDEESKAVGPIEDESGLSGGSVFFFANGEKLVTERYEFH